MPTPFQWLAPALPDRRSGYASQRLSAGFTVWQCSQQQPPWSITTNFPNVAGNELSTVSFTGIVGWPCRCSEIRAADMIVYEPDPVTGAMIPGALDWRESDWKSGLTLNRCNLIPL